MNKNPKLTTPIVLDVERDLKKNMRSINQLLNDNPELAILTLINPLLVLEDLGVKISPAVKQHVMNSLRFPKKLVAQRDQLEKEIKDEFKKMGVKQTLPMNNQQRSKLLFETLKIKPAKTDKDHLKALSSEQLQAYSDHHPLLEKIAKYERFRKGGLVFLPRHDYEEYKSGVKKLHWVNAVKFKT